MQNRAGQIFKELSGHVRSRTGLAGNEPTKYPYHAVGGKR
jgi:hypothetical protein